VFWWSDISAGRLSIGSLPRYIFRFGGGGGGDDDDDWEEGKERKNSS
jgi:hypothetical protein